MRLQFAFLFSLVLYIFVTAPVRAQTDFQVAVERIKSDLEYLAHDDRQGRGLGTEGLKQAGEFIAARFADLGLQTKVFGDSPFQEFGVPNGVEATPGMEGDKPKNWLTLSFNGQSMELPLGLEWNPLSLGSEGEFSSTAVFVGYGISSPEHNYDDYADLNVDGKVVIVLRKEPRDAETGAGFFGGAGTSSHAYFSTKELNAVQHGAAAVIVVNDFKTAQESEDAIFAVSEGGTAVSGHQIPTVNVRRATVDAIVKQLVGKSLEDIEREINTTHKPQSYVLDGLTVAGRTAVRPQMEMCRNVAAILPGSGELANEFVVVGAHYDHVGLGGAGSLAPGTIAVHNGADDNGSGTVGLLEVARELSQTHSDNRRSILFMAFAAEERGLLGSAHYVRYPSIPIEQTVAMINMDMIGRMKDGSLTVFGLGTATQFPQWLDQANAEVQVDLNKENAGYGPSDHQSFYTAGVPAFHLFTGLHSDYHRPSDDTPLIDFNGIARISKLAANLTNLIASVPERPQYLQSDERARIGPNAGKQRARLGVSYDAAAANCLVTAVQEASPAAQAGVQANDVIVKLGEQSIGRGDDLAQAVRQYKPGQATTLQLLRDGQSVQVNIQF